MYTNDYMYAVDRSDEYLAHYGIKGMKWGVRKAIESGSERRLDRAYRKASRKLAKLEKRANNGAKYARRAARLGAGAAVAGTVAGVGVPGVANALGAVGGHAANVVRRVAGDKAGIGLAIKSGKTVVGMKNFANGQTLLPTRNSLRIDKNARDLITKNNAMIQNIKAAKGMSNAYDPGKIKLLEKQNENIQKAYGQYSDKAKNAVNNNTLVRAGAAALGAGLAGAAGYNAYRAATTKRAARKAAEFKSEMNKAFQGTKYANGGNGGQKKRRRR